MTQNRPSRTLFVVYACAIVTGAALICWQTIVFHRQKASFQWPTVSGTIVQSERIYVPSDHNSHYRVEITYNYKVKGTSYVSHRISLFSRDLSSYDDISESFVANHRPGTSVEIYYEPTRPENAVLIPGPDETFSEFEIGVGVIAIIGSFFTIIRLIPRRRRLTALLNAPDAAARTMHLRVEDIDKGTTAFVRNVGAALLFTALAMALLLGQWLDHPKVLLEAPHPAKRGLAIWGIGCVLVVIFFVRRALKKGRSAECPLCGTFLNKTVFSINECPGCRTRIIFDGESVPTDTTTAAAAGAVAQKLVHGQATAHHRTTIRFQLRKDRLADIAGFVTFPILFIWLWAGVEKRADQGGTVVMTVMFLMVGAMYYFVPDSLGQKNRHSSKKATEPKKPGPYLVDSGIIFFGPACLLAYCLYLTWQHQEVGKNGLIGILIGIPVALVLATYICKLRFERATKLNLPEPPSFVPWTLFGLWLLGTFFWIVLVVWLRFKLRG